MKAEQTGVEVQKAVGTREVWVSTNNEVDEDIDREALQFLNELEESKKSKLVLVGWRPS